LTNDCIISLIVELSIKKPSCPYFEVMLKYFALGIFSARNSCSSTGNNKSEIIEITKQLALIAESDIVIDLFFLLKS